MEEKEIEAKQALDAAERKFYRDNGIFLFENRVEMVGLVGRLASELSGLQGKFEGCEIEPPESLGPAVGDLYRFYTEIRKVVRDQRRELFPNAIRLDTKT